MMSFPGFFSCPFSSVAFPAFFSSNVFPVWFDLVSFGSVYLVTMAGVVADQLIEIDRQEELMYCTDGTSGIELIITTCNKYLRFKDETISLNSPPLKNDVLSLRFSLSLTFWLQKKLPSFSLGEWFNIFNNNIQSFQDTVILNTS